MLLAELVLCTCEPRAGGFLAQVIERYRRWLIAFVAPSLPMCNTKTYDYFVLSQSLKQAVVGEAVVGDAGFYPHAPRADQVRALVAPSELLGDVPLGCVQEPKRGLQAPRHWR